MSLLVLGNVSAGFALEIPKLRRNAEGWDEVRELVRAPNQQWVTTGASRSFTGFITGTFFVQDVQCVGCQFGMPILEIISRGVAGTKGVIWESTAYTETSSGSAILGMPGAPAGVAVKGQVAVARVGMTARYISATAPTTTTVGTAISPAVNYGVPAYPFAWASSDLAVYHFPAGWSLAKRDAKQLPGTTYHFVTDYFVHQHNPTV